MIRPFKQLKKLIKSLESLPTLHPTQERPEAWSRLFDENRTAFFNETAALRLKLQQVEAVTYALSVILCRVKAKTDNLAEQPLNSSHYQIVRPDNTTTFMD